MIAVFKQNGEEIHRHGRLNPQPIRGQHVILGGMRYKVERVTMDADSERGVLTVEVVEVN